MDWTQDEAGCSNSSAEYLKVVEALIPILSNMRIGCDPRTEARMIVSQLAHVYGLAPKEQPTNG